MAASNELMHYGILGMKWGVRRYQNKDGTLTELGKKHTEKLRFHYDKASNKLEKYEKKYERKQAKADKKRAKADKKLGFFGSQEGWERKYYKANKAQRRADKVVTKGAKWYKAMENAFGKTYLSNMDSSTVSIGESFINMAAENSKKHVR